MIHQYKLGGYNIVLDVYSGSVHAVDERLDHVGTVFKVKGVVGVGVRRKQLPGCRQLVDIVKAIVDVGGGHIGAPGILLGQNFGGLRRFACAWRTPAT